MALDTSTPPDPAAQQTEGADAAPSRQMITWRSAFILSLGGALLVTVALGAMAAELGAASLLIWTATVAIGTLQCLLLAELASRFPQKVGGAPAYTHEGFKHRSPLFGAVAAWGYWVAWIPGVAVNLTLAATYLEAAFFPGSNVPALTLALAVGLYALNSLGLRPNVWASGLMAACALVPLAIIIVAPLFRPALWHGANFAPLLPAGLSWSAGATWVLLAKWTFVAVWSSYGAEMVATVVGELRDPRRDVPKAIGAASAATTLAFVLVPVVLLAIVGLDGLAQDPYVAFLTAANAVFGTGGARIVAAMLIAALFLGAEVFIISSSRALHQMSRDGLTLRSYGRLNRHGVPVGSLAWDAAITLLLLAIFGRDIVGVVAAANVGYLVVFILLPLAYVLVRRRAADRAPFHLPAIFTPLALAIAAFNALLLVFGGYQWGPKIIGIGLALTLSFLPFHLLRRHSHPPHAGEGRRRVPTAVGGRRGEVTHATLAPTTTPHPRTKKGNHMAHRPILISVMQYEDELNAGTLATRDVIDAAARLGADGIEIRPEFWRDKPRELPEARDLIAAHGLLVTNATRNTLFSAAPDDAARLREDIADTRTLGAAQLRVFSGPLPADDDAAGWAAGQAIIDHAAAQGITLALENYAWTPGGRLAEIARILDRLPSPSLATNIDIGNYTRHGDDVPTAIRTLGTRAVSAHLKDQDGPPDFGSHPLGGGTLPLGAIIAALERLPQRLIYCFEFRGGGDPDGRISRSLAYLRERRWAN